MEAGVALLRLPFVPSRFQTFLLGLTLGSAGISTLVAMQKASHKPDWKNKLLSTCMKNDESANSKKTTKVVCGGS